MNQRLNLLLALAFFLASEPILAQSPEPPRTEHGYPDLQGTYTFARSPRCNDPLSWPTRPHSLLKKQRSGRPMRIDARIVI